MVEEPALADLLAEVVVLDGEHVQGSGEGFTGCAVVVDTYVAEYRDLILADPEWTSALRRILEGFVALGVDAAVARAHDFGDMFR
jgi:hypothetical protein